jgi:hypothetical protein
MGAGGHQALLRQDAAQLQQALGLVELEHNAKNNRMRALP